MKNTLSPEAKQLFKKLATEWNIADEVGRLLLISALECYDEATSAAATIKREGLYVKDRFEQLRLHPAAKRQKESRAHMLQCLKQLGLDLASLER
jgi:P27 family predicted phage terminase small subunit